MLISIQSIADADFAVKRGIGGRRGSLAVHFPKKTGLENGIYLLSFSLSPKIFYPEYPENPRTLGESIRKARIDQGLMIRELAGLVGADEMTIINWELRDRRPKDKFHKPLERVLGIEL